MTKIANLLAPDKKNMALVHKGRHRNFALIILILIIFLLVETTVSAKQRIVTPIKSLSSQIIYENSEYVIRNFFDLGGEKLVIPQGCTLLFEKDGEIANGTVQGNETKIKSSKVNIINNISLRGTFQSNASRPEWFTNLSSSKAINICLSLFQGLLLDNDYLLDTTIIINRTFSIYGNGCISFKKNIKDCIKICAPSVQFSNISISIDNIEATIIHAIGRQSHPLSDIFINNCSIIGGRNAIVFDFCDNSQITDCNISNVDYTAIGLFSAHSILINNNRISNINLDHRNEVSYGVTATYHYGDNKSTDIIISNNFITNNPYWEALDTHGGERIIFYNNIVRNCWRGVAAVGDSHRDIMLCNDITIEDNDICCSDTPLSNGIVFTGVGINSLSKKIKITRNVVSKSVIALYSNHNENISISHNTLSASDEIWRDVGSKDVSFAYNKIELYPGDSSFYEKSVFYFKPTITVRNIKFGDISNNIIITNDAPLLTMYSPFSSYNSNISKNGNIIYRR